MAPNSDYMACMWANRAKECCRANNTPIAAMIDDNIVLPAAVICAQNTAAIADDMCAVLPAMLPAIVAIMRYERG